LTGLVQSLSLQLGVVSAPAGAVDISYEGYSSKDAYLDAVRRADIANNEQLLANELKYAGMWTMERH
jgi:membrane protein required for beta-lactamase induction